MESWSDFPSRLLTCSVLLLLCRWTGAGANDLVILQTPGPLRLTAGENLTLNCMLKGFGPPGAVKWQKGADRSQPPVYNDKEASSSPTSRVARIIPGSNTDYSIRLSNIQPKDAGTYFCVKYKAGSPETEYKLGMGTEVSVIATPSLPNITGPPSRVDSGASVTFNCTSEGFFPQEITLTWIKDRRTIPASSVAVLPPEESTSYQVVSAVDMTLTERDVKSELTCQIHHSTLPGPLRKSFKLGDALRVTPKMSVEPGQLIEAIVNELVTITCSAKGFYPNDTGLAWRENGSETDLPMAESTTQDYDGTFSMRSILEINATEGRNHSVFSCYAVRNSQPLDPVNVTLKIHREGKGLTYSGGAANVFTTRGPLLYILVLICVLLIGLVVAILYFVWAKQKKGKDSTSVRLNESEKTSGGTNQEPDPNNVTYADLNFDKPPQKSPRQEAEVSQKSEYTSVQTAPLATPDDNVTYADLDMVHLSKAPKRPAPQPEEASSEYASVQVQNK